MQQVDVLVWIGAGSLTNYERMPQAKKTVLVDASSVVCKRLKEQFVGNDSVRVLNQAVSKKSGEAVWYVQSLAEYSALSKPKELVNLFPGLKQIGSERRDVVGILDLLSNEIGSEAKNVAVVLDVPDQTSEMLNTLHESAWSAKLEVVIFTGQVGELYEQHRSGCQEFQVAVEAGIYLLQWEDRSEPEFPKSCYRINPLTNVVAQKDTQLRALETERIKLVDNIAHAKAESEKQLAKFRDDCEKIQHEKDALDNQLTSLSEEKEQTEKGITEFRREVADKDKLLNSQIAKLEQERERSEKAAADMKAVNQQISQERDAARKERDSARQERDKLKEQLKNNDEANSVSNNQLAELKNQLSVANKTIVELKTTADQAQKAEQQAKEQKAKFEQHYVQHQKKMAQLEKDNVLLKQENEQTQARQKLLEGELTKAEAQMEIIKELLLKDSEQVGDE